MDFFLPKLGVMRVNPIFLTDHKSLLFHQRQLQNESSFSTSNWILLFLMASAICSQKTELFSPQTLKRPCFGTLPTRGELVSRRALSKAEDFS